MISRPSRGFSFFCWLYVCNSTLDYFHPSLRTLPSMVYLLYWLITPRKTPRVRVHDGNQETWSRLSHQNHSPSLLPWFVTPSGALSSQMPSCGMDTVVRTAAVGYHQPPAGTAIIDIESRTRASVSNAAHRWISCRSRGRSLSYCSFRRIRRSPPGRALASLPWRPARETEAHDHMGRTQASWTQWRQGCLVSVLGEAGRHAPT